VEGNHVKIAPARGKEMSELNNIMTAIARGEARTAEELLPLVYTELRRLAAQELSREKPGQTLQATALVHEAWLRLTGGEQKASEPTWSGRRHFFGAAAEAMRRILIENARRKARVRHGGGCDRLNLNEAELTSPLPDNDLLALDEALNRLAGLDAPAAELVKLRFFTGLTQQQAADLLGFSRSTADRLWLFARAWLYEQVRPTQC
jgi:RNA polymerase sigma factor (TIGR02999 family)